MVSRESQQFKFTINWKLTIACVLMFPILLSLGFWQLDRANKKQTILDEWHAQQAIAPVEIEKLNVQQQGPQSVSVKGRFDGERYWLLENKFYNGVLGYQVVMAFRTAGGELLAVNRGWVKADAYRDTLPEFTTPENETQIQGYLSQPSDFKLLSDTDVDSDTWPIRLLELNFDLLGTQYGETFFPAVLRINEVSPAALLVNWQPVNMLPQKHKAYAVQWFFMAIVLAVLWLVANTNIVNYFKSKPE